MFLLFLKLIANNGSIRAQICCKVTYHDVMTAFSPCNSPTPNAYLTPTESNVLVSFTDWKFSQNQKLLQFPIDRVTDNFIREVHNAVFSFVNTTPFSSRPILAAVSKNALSEILDIDPSSVKINPDFTDLFSGNRAIKHCRPLAHRYGGHQFGSWSGQLGDGRAHLLGEYVNRRGERWELQLKGSGRTPYSRHGDGRAVLRSSVREFLGSEAMYHLGK